MFFLTSTFFFLCAWVKGAHLFNWYRVLLGLSFMLLTAKKKH